MYLEHCDTLGSRGLFPDGLSLGMVICGCIGRCHLVMVWCIFTPLVPTVSHSYPHALPTGWIGTTFSSRPISPSARVSDSSWQEQESENAAAQHSPPLRLLAVVFVDLIPHVTSTIVPRAPDQVQNHYGSAMYQLCILSRRLRSNGLKTYEHLIFFLKFVHATVQWISVY